MSELEETFSGDKAQLHEPRSEKTGLRGFRPGPIQTRLYSLIRLDCTIRVAKTKSLISFAVTAKLICVFVFAYAKAGFLMTRLISEDQIRWAF